MKWSICNGNGVVVSEGVCPDGTPASAFEHMVADGHTLHFSTPDGLELGDRLVGDEVTKRPEAPSKYHDFDDETFSWLIRADASELQSADVRSQRDRLLAACDWTDTVSAPSRLGDAIYAAWQTYRQALRDITDQPGFPAAVIWPDKPLEITNE